MVTHYLFLHQKISVNDIKQQPKDVPMQGRVLFVSFGKSKMKFCHFSFLQKIAHPTIFHPAGEWLPRVLLKAFNNK